MRTLIAVALLASCALALTHETDPFWVSYKKTFEKNYASSDEEAHRYKVFLKNMAKASEYNKEDYTAKYGWTPVSDMDHSEITHPMQVPTNIIRTEVPATNEALPSSWNWIEQGAVNKIKDQASCGSCWAFSSVVAMEGAHFVKHGELLSLSESQLVDCDQNDHGCNGGWPTVGMEWIRDHGGIMLEKDYPYKAYQRTCKFVSSKAAVQIASAPTFPSRNEYKMRTALKTYGPLAVAVDARKFNSYSSGIMSATGCYAGAPDHGVAVVGWGASNGIDYWIVRNSWGKYWGENGYVRMQRGVNCCGVEDYPMGAVAL